jgi:hypothetical protein
MEPANFVMLIIIATILALSFSTIRVIRIELLTIRRQLVHLHKNHEHKHEHVDNKDNDDADNLNEDDDDGIFS